MLLLRFLLIVSLTGLTTAPAPILLRPEPLAISPTQFYVANVVDLRTGRGAYAQLVPTPRAAAETVDVQGGLTAAIARFYQQGFWQNKALRPVTVQINDCRLTETTNERGQIAGRFALALTFAWTRDDELIKLTTFRTGADYTRPPGTTDLPAQSLRRALIDAITYFNRWINQQANVNPLLSQRLRVVFTDYYRATTAREDTVFYSVNHPLTWADFQAPVPRLTRYAAQVFPSISYEGRSRIVDGVTQIELLIKVYNPKSSSWVTEPARNDYALNHEQRHFDVAKIAAERFKRAIVPDSLTVTDFNSQLQYQFIESFRDMGRMQEAYDGETNHGINQSVQARWNQRIDAELKQLGVKK
jgi:hypothetical protein